MSEIGELVLDTANRLFQAHCDKAVLLAAEAGRFPDALWREIEAAGLGAALVPEAAGGPGLAPEEALAILRPAARYAAPVPLAETMLAQFLLAKAGLPRPSGPLTIAPVRGGDRLRLERAGAGWRLAGTATRVPWARNAAAIVVIAEADGAAMVATVPGGSGRLTAGRNLAFEPRDEIAFEALLPESAVAPAPEGLDRDALLALGAATRSVQIAGALAHILEITVRYAGERVQFGRAIGKFQAIQQNLAVLAGQAAAAGPPRTS